MGVEVIGSSMIGCEIGEMQSTSFLFPGNVDDVVDCLWPIFANIKETGINSEGSVAGSGDEGEMHNDRPNKPTYELVQDVIQECHIKVVLCVRQKESHS